LLHIHLKKKKKKKNLFTRPIRRLYEGSISRTTASTDMNASSSRSHAIFTVTLVQNITTTYNQETISKKLESKFHFVDLAGSERVCIHIIYIMQEIPLTRFIMYDSLKRPTQ
jgi:hypothetical protein